MVPPFFHAKDIFFTLEEWFTSDTNLAVLDPDWNKNIELLATTDLSELLTWDYCESHAGPGINSGTTPATIELNIEQNEIALYVKFKAQALPLLIV